MADEQVLRHIHDLVEEEHRLRAGVQDGSLSTEDEHTRLRAVGEQLDQLWDLLRRRRAARDQGGDPDAVAQRPISDVESYRQ
jgi:hypothetical protein